MIIDGLNLNHLRIFECVYRTRSMTAAAKELHLTQSGVSQHMRAFEEALAIPLFDRVKQKIIPTSAADSLYVKCSEGLHGVERALSELKGGSRELKGLVAIGMPIEFGNNVVVPLLAEFARKHPGVSFQFKLGFASSVNERLLNGAIDFGIIDDFAMDRSVVTEKVYDEILDLCISRELYKKFGVSKNSRRYFEELPFVDYQKDEPILRMWFQHHLGARALEVKVRAYIMDVQGLLRLIQCSMGAGILPHHLAQRLHGGESLHVYRGCGKPLKNSISLAWLRDRTHSPASLAVMDFLRAKLVKDSA